jgi:hypothetical protein
MFHDKVFCHRFFEVCRDGVITSSHLILSHLTFCHRFFEVCRGASFTIVGLPQR